MISSIISTPAPTLTSNEPPKVQWEALSKEINAIIKMAQEQSDHSVLEAVFGINLALQNALHAFQQDSKENSAMQEDVYAELSKTIEQVKGRKTLDSIATQAMSIVNRLPTANSRLISVNPRDIFILPSTTTVKIGLKGLFRFQAETNCKPSLSLVHKTYHPIESNEVMLTFDIPVTSLLTQGQLDSETRGIIYVPLTFNAPWTSGPRLWRTVYDITYRIWLKLFPPTPGKITFIQEMKAGTFIQRLSESQPQILSVRAKDQREHTITHSPNLNRQYEQKPTLIKDKEIGQFRRTLISPDSERMYARFLLELVGEDHTGQVAYHFEWTERHYFQEECTHTETINLPWGSSHRVPLNKDLKIQLKAFDGQICHLTPQEDNHPFIAFTTCRQSDSLFIHAILPSDEQNRKLRVLTHFYNYINHNVEQLKKEQDALHILKESLEEELKTALAKQPEAPSIRELQQIKTKIEEEITLLLMKIALLKQCQNKNAHALKANTMMKQSYEILSAESEETEKLRLDSKK